MEYPCVSVVVPTRNRIDKLTRCLASVVQSDYPRFDIVVIDDSSFQDVTRAIGADFPNAKIVRNENRKLLSYSRNLGASISSGEILFFLDDDNVIAPDTIRELVSGFSSTRIGVVSPVIYTAIEPVKVWTSSIKKGKLPGFYVLGHDEPITITETFSFHDAFAVRKSVFEGCGEFDSTNFPIHFGELDFAYRLHAKGYQAVVNPRAKVWHDVGSAETHVDPLRSYYTLRNRLILLRRYAPRGEYAFYAAFILPLLSAYYLVHFTVSASNGRLETATNLLRGIVDGLSASSPNSARKTRQH